MIKMTVDAGKAADIPVAVCGEMAGDDLYTLILLGLGVTELSMHAASIPRIKRLISKTSLDEARKLAEVALGMSTAVEIHEYVENYVQTHFPSLFDPLGELAGEI
jgi:phosphotransferase system enzyme I (PtsI)